MIDIETYNDYEIRGRIGLSVRALHIGAPVTFDLVGYPHRVYQEAELASCVDLFGGGSWGNHLREFYGNEPFDLSPDEVELARTIGDGVVELTRAAYGHGMRPWVGPLNYIRIFRAISYLSGLLGRKLTVFEVGGGAGYLGCLLALTGHRYVATDIAQNMYLWQNRLYAKFTGERFQEFATVAPGKPVEIDPSAQIIHIPWWHYAAFYKSGVPFRADVLVSERNLGEMTVEGRDYTFAVGRDVLAGPPGVIGTRRGEGIILFTGIGSGHVTGSGGVGETAARFGFKPIMEDVLVMLAHRDSRLGDFAIADAYGLPASKHRSPSVRHPIREFDWRRHRHIPSGRTNVVHAADYLPLKWSEAATGYPWLRYLDWLEGLQIAD